MKGVRHGRVYTVGLHPHKSLENAKQFVVTEQISDCPEMGMRVERVGEEGAGEKDDEGRQRGDF